MKIAGKTDIGQVRSTNQDTFHIEIFDKGTALVLVCDGMGGVRGGDKASLLAKEAAASAVRQRLAASGPHELLTEAVHAANCAVLDEARREPGFAGMGTTLVAALLTPALACIAHVGDSRLYLLRGGRLTQITRDHSRVQELIEAGKITREEAWRHPDRNVITRAVGVEKQVEADLQDLPLERGDKLLLCTDGLSGYCAEGEIAQALGRLPAEDAVEELVRLANAAGGYDNITAAVAEI